MSLAFQEPENGGDPRNEFHVLYALFACGCVQRIRFPQLGERSCPRHTLERGASSCERVGWTRHAPDDRERPY